MFTELIFPMINIIKKVNYGIDFDYEIIFIYNDRHFIVFYYVILC